MSRKLSIVAPLAVLSILFLGCTSPSDGDSTAPPRQETALAPTPTIEQIEADYAARASEQLDAGAYDEALDLVLIALGEDPENSDALALQGWLIAFSSGDIEVGRRLVERAISVNPNESKYRIQLAEIFMAAHLWDEAESELQTARRLGESEPRVKLRLAKIALGQDDTDAALLIVKDAIANSPDNDVMTDLALLEAVVNLSQGEYQTALDSLDSLLADVSPFIDLAFGLANLGIRTSAGNQLVLFDQEINAVDPSVASIVEAMSQLTSDPNTERLLTWDVMLLSLVNSVQDTVVSPIVDYTIQLEEAGFVEEAATALLRIQTWVLRDWKSYSHGERANLLSDLGRDEEALKEYTTAINLVPTSFRYAGRAVVETRLNGSAAAIPDWLLAIELDPADAKLRSSVANIFLNIGNFEAASEQLVAAIRLGSKDPEIYKAALDTFGVIGDFDLGISEATAAAALFRQDGTFLAYRGSFYHRLGNFDQASMDFDQAIALDPDNPSAYSFRAGFRVSQGDIEGAVKDAEMSLELGLEEPLAESMRSIIALDTVIKE